MIIAEIGQNHNGDMGLAKKLIRLAKENGADLAKFQLYDHDKLYGDKIRDASLSFEQAKMLFDYGREVGIEVFFSVFDVERVKWCEEIGVKRYKLARTLKDQATIRDVLATSKPVISSRPHKAPHYPMKMLLCISKYPASIADYQLGRNKFTRFYDGISDHTIGLDATKSALVLGARIIEKHFAIDHKTGVDAPWSMTPEELRELVRFSKIIKEVL